jgi:hypothetical protein
MAHPVLRALTIVAMDMDTVITMATTADIDNVIHKKLP